MMANREIKFRAWDGEMMLDWLLICQSAFNRGETQLMYDVLTSPNFIKMQYTGLKDKNGVEIYEGDKVMAVWERASKGGYLQSSDAYVEYKEFGVFEWHNLGFVLKNEGKIKTVASDAVFTIIGNIYENPELL
jgi:uncharacterized phage protein (TIGR01671 family)